MKQIIWLLFFTITSLLPMEKEKETDHQFKQRLKNHTHKWKVVYRIPFEHSMQGKMTVASPPDGKMVITKIRRLRAQKNEICCVYERDSDGNTTLLLGTSEETLEFHNCPVSAPVGLAVCPKGTIALIESDNLYLISPVRGQYLPWRVKEGKPLEQFVFKAVDFNSTGKKIGIRGGLPGTSSKDQVNIFSIKNSNDSESDDEYEYDNFTEEQ